MPRGKHNGHVRGEAHPHFKGGHVEARTGYIQVQDPRGGHRNIYQHRLIYRELAAEHSYYPLDDRGFPIVERRGKRKKIDVHHFDQVKGNNCLCNLTFLEDTIHRHTTITKQTRGPDGKWISWEEHSELYGEEV